MADKTLEPKTLDPETQAAMDRLIGAMKQVTPVAAPQVSPEVAALTAVLEETRAQNRLMYEQLQRLAPGSAAPAPTAPSEWDDLVGDLKDDGDKTLVKKIAMAMDRVQAKARTQADNEANQQWMSEVQGLIKSSGADAEEAETHITGMIAKAGGKRVPLERVKAYLDKSKAATTKSPVSLEDLKRIQGAGPDAFANLIARIQGAGQTPSPAPGSGASSGAGAAAAGKTEGNDLDFATHKMANGDDAKVFDRNVFRQRIAARVASLGK